MSLRARALVLIVLSSVAGTIVGVQPAMANKPLHVFEHSVSFVCDLPGITNSVGTLLTSVEDHSEFGTSSSVLYWVTPETPETNEDSTFRSSSLAEDEHITRTGYHFDAVIGMEDRDFNPIGDAILTADLVATGQVDGPAGNSKFGNRNIHDKSTVKFLVVDTGTVTLPDGVVFDISGCPGFDSTIDFTVTDPSQFVISFSGILVLCDVSTSDYSLNLGASSADGTTTFFFSDAAGNLNGFADDISLTSDEFHAVIPASDDDGSPVGDAVVAVSFERGARLVVRTEDGGIRSKRVGTILVPTGTITIPTSPATVIDLSSCFAFDGREQQKEHRPSE